MATVPVHMLAAAAIIGWLGPGSFAACTGRGHSIGTDHAEQDRRDENLRAQLVYSDRPPSHGWLAADAVRPPIERRGRAGRQRPCERADARRDRKSSAAILHVVFGLRDPWPSSQQERCMP
jgi:hypothetical protein